MQTIPVQQVVDAPGATALRASVRLGQGMPGPAAGRDAQFVDLLNAYRRSGGLARADDVCASIQQHGVPMTMLARWIAGRDLLHFEWQGENWLPMFQFDGIGLQPRPAVGQVLAELADVMPAWQVAQWFVQPNSVLAGLCPADALATDARAVVQAARTDRYLIDA